MRTPGRPDRPEKRSGPRGATLVELLAAMAILSVLVLVLAALLDAAMRCFRDGAETVEQRGGARVVADWLERDLASHLSSRPAPLPRLPEGVPENQRKWFEARIFLPLEIDRASGTGAAAARSFANAAPGFGSIAFATRAPERSGDPATTAPAVVGYYVAYARHSPLAGEEGAGMKLFRHYRPGGHPGGEGYADGMLRYLSRAINDGRDLRNDASVPALGEENPAMLRRGRFENADLPFLISRRLVNGTGLPREVVQPWPSLPVRERLQAPPPSYQPVRGDPAAWDDPGNPVHDSVFPDELVCDHVVRFELKPYRRVELPNGASELMDAAALNRHLGLGGGEEWPVLVAPDFIDVLVGVVPESLALRLVRYEDWIVDWSRTNPAAWSPERQRLGREARVHRFRIALPPRSA